MSRKQVAALCRGTCLCGTFPATVALADPLANSGLRTCIGHHSGPWAALDPLLARIRRRIASATPIGATATSRPRTIQRSRRRVSARTLRSSPSTHLAGASTELRIETDARNFHHPADMPATAISFTMIREERSS